MQAAPGQAHALEVEGAIGGKEFEVATDLLAPGERTALILELPPGEYELYCPVPGHADAGMEGKLILRGES